MIIKKVPEIIGPNFGGIIYGLNLKHGYSTAPSELTLNIVSRNGQYNIENTDLNKLQTIKFGSFQFTGYVWEYKINTTSEESLLEVKLVDGSIILDRYWVMLWKRGLLGSQGQGVSENITFNFDESLLVPSFLNGRVRFTERDLPSTSISIPYRYNRAIVGNVLLIGTEQIPNNSCEIPTTDYNFSEFATICPVSTVGLTIDPDYRATFEGRLRDVLNSWCESTGYSFYWDFANNNIKYYDSTRGFGAQLPNVSTANIISKEISYSMKGTFKQFAVSYAAKPKESLKTLTGSTRIQDSFLVNPYSLDFFVGKEAREQGLLKRSGRWGKGRGKNEFIQSAVCGMINPDLRFIYNVLRANYSVLGIEGTPIKSDQKIKFIKFLIAKGFDAMNELQELSKNLQDYDIFVGTFNEEYADQWNSLEQETLAKTGSFYSIGVKSGEFYFCKPTSFTSVSIQVEPEATLDEEKTSDFYGARIFNRGGGGIAPSNTVALEELKFEEKGVQAKLDLLKPRTIPLKESGLFEALVRAKLITRDKEDQSPALIFTPNEKLIKQIIKFDIATQSGGHPLETTIDDARAAAQENKAETCDDLEETKEKGSCKSYEDIAREIALKKLQTQKKGKDLYAGLVTADCKTVKISTGSGGRTIIYLPSESPYQVVVTADIQTEQISIDEDDRQLLYSSGNVSGPVDNVEQIEVILNNVTDSKFEKFRSSARKNALPKAREVSATKPLSRISYVFAGEPTINNLTPSNGIESLDVSLSSDGFKTSVSFANRAPKRGNIDAIMDKVNSQFRRNAYNGG
jgi:hypothetical protein